MTTAVSADEFEANCRQLNGGHCGGAAAPESRFESTPERLEELVTSFLGAARRATWPVRKDRSRPM